MDKNPHAGLPALLMPESSVVLLIDHQAFQIASINSHEPTMIANNVAGLAEGAKVYDIPHHPHDRDGTAGRASHQGTPERLPRPDAD
jgi:hypothetical protein